MFAIFCHFIAHPIIIGKNILIIGIKLPIINTFLHINQKLFILQKQNSVLWKARVMSFSKSTKTFM